jgi:ferredoxin
VTAHGDLTAHAGHAEHGAAADEDHGTAGEDGVRVKAHPALCRGVGNCHRFAPDVYPLDEDGLLAVHLLDVPASLALDAWRGASVCPERAITVIGPPEQHWIDRLAEATSRPATEPAGPKGT